MENTDTPIQTEESTTTKTVEPVTEDTPNINGEQPTTVEPVTEDTPNINGEQPTIDETESVEKKEDEIIPTTITTEEEITKPIDEQENVTDTNTNVPPTSVSPVRVNIPLKEVNESEKEEPIGIANGTENTISKKRELEQDEQSEETTNDNDERIGDQTKKIKITEAIDTPIIETTETENNIIVNGNTAVEV